MIIKIGIKNIFNWIFMCLIKKYYQLFLEMYQNRILKRNRSNNFEFIKIYLKKIFLFNWFYFLDGT